MKKRNRMDFISWIRLSGKAGTIGMCILLIPVVLFMAQSDVLADLIRSGKQIPESYFLTFVRNGIKTDTMKFFLPLLCVLPYACRFAEDVHCGVLRLILARSSRAAYLRKTMIYGALAGGLLPAAGLLLSVGFSFLTFFLIGNLQAEEAEEWRTAILSLIQMLCLSFAFGSLWTSFGMLCSVFSQSLPVSCLSPFILYYLLIILYERYFPYTEIFYPKAWLDPGNHWPLGGWSAFFWMMELTILISLLFLRSAERRLCRV